MSHGCAAWCGDLGAYVLGALEGEERAAMRRHLAACAGCHADLEDLLRVGDWLASAKRHLATCQACRAHYENLLQLRPAN